MPGFFATHGSYAQTNFDAAPDGLYRCRLKEVTPEERPAYEDPSTTEQVYKFVFETLEEKDSNGRPFRFFVSPKRIAKDGGGTYGNERAALTKLLDGMLGRRLSAEEFENLDLDELLTRTYKVLVEQRDSSGKPRNKVLKVTGMGGSKEDAGANLLSRPAPPPAPTLSAAGASVAVAQRQQRPVASATAVVPDADDLSDLNDPFQE